MSNRIQLGLVGVGKIARAQHLPALVASEEYQLAAAVSRESSVEGVATFTDINDMIAAVPTLEAVSLCVPPAVRGALARASIAAGLHVMLEKPPGVTVGEVLELARQAELKGTCLFTSWHSREAPGVEPARRWLLEREVSAVRVNWLEDVRIWHPGQEWIWQAGGFGVFDPGINALSILTRILPGSLQVSEATLSVPSNRHAPIEAELTLTLSSGARVSVFLSFCRAFGQRWDIDVDTDRGRILLCDGGSGLQIDGSPVAVPSSQEYPRLYSRFASLIRDRKSDVDVTPLRLVSDAFLCARTIEVEPFTS